jgi:membrane-associated phospholipid phosphatase
MVPASRATHPSLRWLVASALLIASTSPAEADAQQAANSPGWAFGHAGGEVGLALGSLATLAAAAIPTRFSGWGPSPARPHEPHIALASDFAGGFVGSAWQLTGSWALEGSYYHSHQVRRPYALALRSTLVAGEATALTLGITEVLKRTTGRCRPRSYRDGMCRDAPEERKAFPSGHTAPMAAIAGVDLLLALRSDGDPTRRYLAFGFAEAGTVATAILRVLAGAHSWEDVVAGWAIGHTTGALVELAHPMESRPGDTVEAAPLRAPMLAWSGSF